MSYTKQPYAYDPRHQALNHFTTKDKLSTSEQLCSITATSRSTACSTLRASLPVGASSLLGDPASTSTAPGTATSPAFATTPLGRPASTGSALAAAQRPNSKGTPRVWQSQDAEANPQVRPPFLTARGTWSNEHLPGMVVPSQAQVLAAPGKFTGQGTLRGSQRVEGPKAIAAVHTYNDVSPAVNTECAHDTRAWAHRTADSWDPSVQKLRTARFHSDAEVEGGLVCAEDRMMTTSRETRRGTLRTHVPAPGPTAALAATIRGDGPPGVPAPGAKETSNARAASVQQFWARIESNSNGYNLNQKDLIRSADPLATRNQPASNNARLIGSHWRYVERPVPGTSLFTDYYGRYEAQTGNYYGRSWTHVPQ